MAAHARRAGTVHIEGNTPALAEVSDSFSLLDYAGGDVVRGKHEFGDGFIVARVPESRGGDLSIDDCESLVRVEGGTFNRVQWLSGSLIVSKPGFGACRSCAASPTSAPTSPGGKRTSQVSEPAPEPSGLVGRGRQGQAPRGNLGRCGRYPSGMVRCTSATRVSTGTASPQEPGALRARVVSVLIPSRRNFDHDLELKTTAALAQASGQMDSLQTPAAALTMFGALTDGVGFDPSVDFDAIRLRAEAAQSPNALSELLPRAHHQRVEAFE